MHEIYKETDFGCRKNEVTGLSSNFYTKACYSKTTPFHIENDHIDQLLLLVLQIIGATL